MTTIETCTQNLIDAILKSDEYRQFTEIRDKVAQEPGLKDQIDAFRLNVFEVQNSDEPLDMYEEQGRLGREYDEFCKNPLVHEFLKAELRVCRIIQGITFALVEHVDIDTANVADKIKP